MVAEKESVDAAAVVEQFDRPIAFHPAFKRLTGSTNAAVMLGQALYWHKRCPEGRDGWWWKTREQWEEETGLTRAEQENARKRLKKLGLLEEERRGAPAKLWYRLDTEELTSQLATNAPSRLRETHQVEDAPSRRRQTRQHSRRETSQQDGGKRANTSKITSETPSLFPPGTSSSRGNGGTKNRGRPRRSGDVVLQHVENSLHASPAKHADLTADDPVLAYVVDDWGGWPAMVADFTADKRQAQQDFGRRFGEGLTAIRGRAA